MGMGFGTGHQPAVPGTDVVELSIERERVAGWVVGIAMSKSPGDAAET